MRCPTLAKAKPRETAVSTTSDNDEVCVGDQLVDVRHHHFGVAVSCWTPSYRDETISVVRSVRSNQNRREH